MGTEQKKQINSITAAEYRKMVAVCPVNKKGRLVAVPENLLNREIIHEELPTEDLFYKFGKGDKNSFFIPGEVKSSKNNHQIFYNIVNTHSNWKFFDNKKQKLLNIRPYVTQSKATKEYIAQTKSIYEGLSEEFRTRILSMECKLPLVIQFTFIRATKAERWDFNNMTEVVQDMMVSSGWIEDDSILYLLPIPPIPPVKPYFYDKDNPGVFITIMSY